LGMRVGPASPNTAMSELVVPRSMPISAMAALSRPQTNSRSMASSLRRNRGTAKSSNAMALCAAGRLRVVGNHYRSGDEAEEGLWGGGLIQGLVMLEKIHAPPGQSVSASGLYAWDELVQEDRVHRLIYTDRAIFQAEMTQIFGAVWVYLGHESQIAKNDDFITTRLGLRPIILLRDSQGVIRAL